MACDGENIAECIECFRFSSHMKQQSSQDHTLWITLCMVAVVNNPKVMVAVVNNSMGMVAAVNNPIGMVAVVNNPMGMVAAVGSGWGRCMCLYNPKSEKVGTVC